MRDAYRYDSHGNLAGLLSGYAVSGQVTDASGNAIASAMVTLMSESNPQDQYSTATLQDGSYAFPAVPPGTYDLVVLADGYQAFVGAAVVVSGTTSLSATALIVSTTQLKGVVVDPTGLAVPGANVVVTDASGHVLGIAMTGHDGGFAITTAFAAEPHGHDLEVRYVDAHNPHSLAAGRNDA